MRGPKHSAKKGKTAVLTAEEARALLDSIEPSSALGNDNILYHSLPSLQARNRFVGRLPKMVTIRPSEWPLRNAPNGIPRPWRVCQDLSRPDSSHMNHCASRKRVGQPLAVETREQ